QGLAGVSYEVKLDFVDWKLDKGVEASAFDFTPPDGVEKVDTFNPHAKGGPKPTPAAGAEGLVGKPAPGFSLDVLGGGKADLAAHKGKDIVVLDFWATWCGPCRRALPVIASACGKFENVKMYAVNLREDVERISKFLETQDLKVTVALDKGETGQAYGANRIPLSIVIDKDGVVQAIHRGFSDDLGSQLEGELKQLLEGKKLAPPQ
ncbi:MAG: redoxin domain-containing protein, partial [Phycisphaerales bacterium]|nr:redoxin domain-containing protein [Phycisphaerales bacterium]